MIFNLDKVFSAIQLASNFRCAFYLWTSNLNLVTNDKLLNSISP